MAWLAVSDEQRTSVEQINASSPFIRVNIIKGAAGGWIVNADALSDAVPGGPLDHFAAWYASLTPTSDVPAPRPPRPRTR